MGWLHARNGGHGWASKGAMTDNGRGNCPLPKQNGLRLWLYKWWGLRPPVQPHDARRLISLQLEDDHAVLSACAALPNPARPTATCSMHAPRCQTPPDLLL
eukprot:354656-Chlamydomonas_euryale.AAC.1